MEGTIRMSRRDGEGQPHGASGQRQEWHAGAQSTVHLLLLENVPTGNPSQHWFADGRMPSPWSGRRAHTDTVRGSPPPRSPWGSECALFRISGRRKAFYGFLST